MDHQMLEKTNATILSNRCWRRRVSDTGADCPFEDNVCIADAFSVESSFIDSHLHLGIKEPKAKRITAKKKLVCAMINLERYSSPLVNEILDIDIPGHLVSVLAKVKKYNIGSFSNQNFNLLVSNHSFMHFVAYETS